MGPGSVVGGPKIVTVGRESVTVGLVSLKGVFKRVSSKKMFFSLFIAAGGSAGNVDNYANLYHNS